MELNELIEKLEEAQGQATEGEWSVENRYLVDRSQPAIRSVGVVETDEQAQAIATRHNTSRDVLESLKNLSAALAVALFRAEKAESESARLRQALIATGINPRLVAAIAEGDPS